MALALLGGYAWLAVAGVLWIVAGKMGDPPSYGAMLHALFLALAVTRVIHAARRASRPERAS